MAEQTQEGWRWSSTKLVQEEKASDKDAEGDPKMNVRGNRTERGAEASRGHSWPRGELLNLECHLRDGSPESQSGPRRSE